MTKQGKEAPREGAGGDRFPKDKRRWKVESSPSDGLAWHTGVSWQKCAVGQDARCQGTKTAILLKDLSWL
jgi:hypothetical protein